MVIFHCFVNVYQRVVSAIFGFLEKQNEYVNMSTQMREMEQVAATQPEI